MKDIIIDDEFKNLIPPLSNDEYKTLSDSILNEGCRDPIVLWDKILLDGHNRFKICTDNGLVFKRVEKNFDNREQAKIWILENQLGRRNLNEAQRIDIVDKLFGLKETQEAEKRMKNPMQNFAEGEKGETNKKLGEKAKVSKETYRKGKQVKENNKELWNKCIDGQISIDKAYIQVKNDLNEQKRNDKSKQGEDIQLDINDIDLRYGDFINVLNDIPNNSIDCIITDPPYPIEFIDEWDKLGKFAKQKLKPNGFMIAYCGHKNLFESMKKLNNYLDYYWIFALLHKGNTQLIKFNNIDASWKPILVYQNGYEKIYHKIKDIVEGSGRNKDNHIWQQSDNEIIYLINNFTAIGDLIVDPFVGSGTILIMSKKNNRRCIGAEKDKKTFNIAKKRIKDEF